MKFKRMIQFTIFALASILFIAGCKNGNEIDSSGLSVSDKTSETPQYTVFYYDNFTDSYPLTLRVNEGDYARNIDDLNRDGHVFSGWYKEEECTNIFSFTTPITEDTYLYAKWEKIEFSYYTITFTNCDLSSLTIKEEDSFQLPELTEEGYHFDGWLYENDLYDPGVVFYPEKDMIFSAQFTEYVTLTYDLNGGTGLEQVKYTYLKGEEVQLIKTPVSKENYEFDGWYFNKEKMEDKFTITTSMTVIARWIGYFSISFEDLTGEGTLPAATEILNGETFTIPSYDGTYLYHEFIGFKDQNGDLYVPGEKYVISDQDVTFIAYYKIITYIVTFYDWDNTVLYNMTVEANEGIDAYPTTFASTIDEFIGWDLSLSSLQHILARTEVHALYTFSDYLLPASQFTFVETMDGYLIGKKGTTYTGELYLPASYKGKRVIGTIVSDVYSNCGFQGCREITAVHIPSTYQTINKNAFYNCSKLEVVTGMESVTCLDTGAFQSCLSLSDVRWPASLREIGNSAFHGTKLIDLVLPEGVEKIGTSSFQNNTSLQSFHIPSTLNEIGVRSFSGCKLLNKITVAANHLQYAVFDEILYEVDEWRNPLHLVLVPLGNASITNYLIPSTLLTIQANAFAYSPYLQTVDYEENSCLQSIGTYAFIYASNLTQVTIPGTVEEIGTYAFANITADVILEEGIETIGSYSFVQYKGNTITLPSTVTTIDDFGFYQSEVQKVYINDESRLVRIGRYAFLECKKLSSFNSSQANTFIIPDQVIEIGDFAFYQNVLLKHLVLSTNLKTIGPKAFAGNYVGKDSLNDDLTLLSTMMHIERLTIPASVEKIGYMAFAYNIDLLEVVFDDYSCLDDFGSTMEDSSGTYRGYVFESCVALQRVDFGANSALKILKMGVFARCKSLIEVNYNLNSQIEYLDSCVFIHCLNLSQVSIPENTYYIGAQVFMDTAITEMYIPENVEILESQSFRLCKNLSRVTFASNVKIEYLSYWLFSDCTSLVQITLPASIKTIGSWYQNLFMTYIFDNCTALENIYVDENNLYFASVDGVVYNKNLTELHLFPMNRESYRIIDRCKVIKDYAFYRSSISTIDLNEVDTIGIGAFQYSKITDVVLKGTIRELGNAVFSSCAYLKSVTFQNGFVLDTLPFIAFSSCNNLTTVIFEEGSQVNTFDRAVFSSCKKLTYFEIHMKVPPTLTYNSFGYVDANTLQLKDYYPGFTIYVPENLLTVYKQDVHWSAYSKVTQALVV